MSRILFVDDDRNILDGLRRSLFRHRGEFTMTFENDPANAMAVIRDTPFEAVVTDFRMPEVDGAELLRAVRTHQPACARIILSGHVHEEDMVRAATIAHQFLSKPCDLEVLVDALRRATRVAALLPWDDLREQVGALQLLPSTSSVIAELQTALDSHTAEAGDIAALARRTPSLAAKMLQLANSSFFGIGHRVDDVTQAAALLGTAVIRSLVLMSGLVRGLDDETTSPWLTHVDHVAYERARTARQLAPDHDVNPELAFSGALLQELGQIVMVPAAPRPPSAEAARDWILEAEATHSDLDHARIGAFLLSLWGLPLAIVEAVGSHTTAPSSPLEACMRHAQSLVELDFDPVCTTPHEPTAAGEQI